MKKRKPLELQLKIRIDKVTLDAFRIAAARSQMSLSEWVRTRCNGTALEAVAPNKAA